MSDGQRQRRPRQTVCTPSQSLTPAHRGVEACHQARASATQRRRKQRIGDAIGYAACPSQQPKSIVPGQASGLDNCNACTTGNVMSRVSSACVLLRDGRRFEVSTTRRRKPLRVVPCSHQVLEPGPQLHQNVRAPFQGEREPGRAARMSCWDIECDRHSVQPQPSHQADGADRPCSRGDRDPQGCDLCMQRTATLAARPPDARHRVRNPVSSLYSSPDF